MPPIFSQPDTMPVNNTGTNTAATTSINTFFADDPALRAELINIASTFECYALVRDVMVSFFSSPQNIHGIKDALAQYGMPARNREATRSGGLFGHWTDYCDWEGCYKFYAFAKISMDFPTLENNNNNCNVIKSALAGLDQARLHAITNDPGAVGAIDDKITDYNALYANMNCDVVIKNQAAAAAAAQAQAIADHAAQLQIEAQQKQAAIAAQAAQNAAALQLQANAQNASNTANIAGTGSKGTNTYMVYAIIGASVLLMLGAYQIFKNKTK